MKKWLLLMVLNLPALAWAHGGGAHGHFMDGLFHPFLGADHVLAMVLVGVWARIAPQRWWIAPSLFLLHFSVGVVLGGFGMVIPLIEPMLSLSVMAIAALLISPRMKETLLRLSLLLIAIVALVHGMAHGGELSSQPTVMVGMLIGAALLHALGLMLAGRLFNGRVTLQDRHHAILSTQVVGKVGVALGVAMFINTMITL
jgi:urease accessory protein